MRRSMMMAKLSRKPARVFYNQRYVNTADNTNYTFNSVNIGPASADRLVVIGATASHGTVSGRVINGITLNGTAMTQVVQRFGGGSLSTGVGLYSLKVPSGTTATIVVNGSGAFNSCGISSWYILDAGNVASTAEDSQGSTYRDLTISLAEGTAAISMSTVVATTTPKTTVWTGVTEKFDQVLETNTTLSGGNSDSSITAPVTITTTLSPQTNITRQTLVGASWTGLPIPTPSTGTVTMVAGYNVNMDAAATPGNGYSTWGPTGTVTPNSFPGTDWTINYCFSSSPDGYLYIAATDNLVKPQTVLTIYDEAGVQLQQVSGAWYANYWIGSVLFNFVAGTTYKLTFE